MKKSSRPRVNTHVETELYTRKQVQVKLGLTEHTVRAMIMQGYIKTVRFGTIVRVPKKEVDRLLEEGCPELKEQPRGLHVDANSDGVE